MAWKPKINRHIHYITASGKLRTARITAVTSNTVVTAKTYKGSSLANKNRHFSVAVNGTRADKWRATA